VTKRIKNKGSKSKATRILWVVCPVVLIGLAVWLITAYGASPAGPLPSGNSLGPSDRVDVVYFHRTARCSSCTWLEDKARYAVETYFADELVSGKVTFRVIDVQDKANADIVEEYDAFTSSLFINTVRGGADHIEQATDVYYLIGREEEFVTALKSKIEKCLNGET